MYESHTGANGADFLKWVSDQWHLNDKDLVLVTDNAANLVDAAQLGGLVHLRCYAHVLNLACQRALKLASVSRLLARSRLIVSFFHRSTVGACQLEEKQKLLGLQCHKVITDVSTRWNSAYEMVDRFLEQQPAICAALLSPLVRKGESDICTLNETDVSNADS